MSAVAENKPIQRPKVAFYDQPRLQPALKCIDQWADRLLGHTGSRVTGAYEARTNAGRMAGPSNVVLGSAEVGRLLEKLGQPAYLCRLLVWRYPRYDDGQGLIHRNSIDSFTCESLRVFQRSWALKDWEVNDLLAQREREFVKDLARMLGRSGR